MAKLRLDEIVGDVLNPTLDKRLADLEIGSQILRDRFPSEIAGLVGMEKAYSASFPDASYRQTLDSISIASRAALEPFSYYATALDPAMTVAFGNVDRNTLQGFLGTTVGSGSI